MPSHRENLRRFGCHDVQAGRQLSLADRPWRFGQVVQFDVRSERHVNEPVSSLADDLRPFAADNIPSTSGSLSIVTVRTDYPPISDVDRGSRQTTCSVNFCNM